MAVKSSVLQSVATASYEAPLAKIKQSQMLLGGGTFITSLFYYSNLYLVWVGKGKEGNTITRLAETTQRFTVYHPEAWM